MEVFRDGKRVLECLQKALKVADAYYLDQVVNAELFTDLLNWYVYWYEFGVPNIQAKYLNGLCDLVLNNLSTIREQDTS